MQQFWLTHVCGRFRPNASLPFSAKRTFVVVFGQTQVYRFSAKRKFAVFGRRKFAVSRPTQALPFSANTTFGQCHVFAKRQCECEFRDCDER